MRTSPTATSTDDPDSAKKKLTLPQIQFMEKIIGVPVAMVHQVPTVPVR